MPVSFQLSSMRQENLDCREGRLGYVDRLGAHYEQDGSVRIIVGRRLDDPARDARSHLDVQDAVISGDFVT